MLVRPQFLFEGDLLYKKKIQFSNTCQQTIVNKSNVSIWGTQAPGTPAVPFAPRFSFIFFPPSWPRVGYCSYSARQSPLLKPRFFGINKPIRNELSESLLIESYIKLNLLLSLNTSMVYRACETGVCNFTKDQKDAFRWSDRLSYVFFSSLEIPITPIIVDLNYQYEIVYDLA